MGKVYVYINKETLRLVLLSPLNIFVYRLQAQKRNLSLKAEEVGEMQGQNSKMLEDIETLGETHKYV